MRANNANYLCVQCLIYKKEGCLPNSSRTGIKVLSSWVETVGIQAEKGIE